MREFAIDAWRAAAIVRVVALHITNFSLLQTIFPAIGVMFALGGSLTARSLAAADATGAGERRVVLARFRRTLPTVWVYGAVIVTIATVLHWGWQGTFQELVSWLLLLNIPDDVGPGRLTALNNVLWYVTVYLWLVLLSPMLLRTLRAFPWLTVLVAAALPQALYREALEFGGILAEELRNILHYLVCWVIGMAHREGLLARVSGWLLWPVVTAVAALVTTMAFASGSPLRFGLGEPALSVVWESAFAAGVLWLVPPLKFARSGRGAIPVPALLGDIVRAINHRAMTIYVWHFACLLLAERLLGPSAPVWMRAAVTVTALLVAVLSVGWVEDVAARRPIRLVG